MGTSAKDIWQQERVLCTITPMKELLSQSQRDSLLIIIRLSEMLHATVNSFVEVEATALLDE